MTETRFSSDEFLKPSAAWRGKPFWSWNGRLEKAELIRQVQVLKAMGMGGFFMHSRTGLVTEYLGEEWFELINACAEEGARLGLEGWLYDEDRWPSGTAGGKVTSTPDYRAKFIHMEKFAGDGFDFAAWKRKQDRPLGAWSCRLENEVDLHEAVPVRAETSAAELAGRTVLAFRIVPMGNGPFYNGHTYVDTMKREATEAYIRLTHEAYRTHCGQYFGNAVKGIFTDEPHRGPFMSGFGAIPGDGEDVLFLVPWTDALFDAFAAAHGVRVEDRLPELFLRPGGAEVTQLKAQYAETMLALYLANFAKPCYDWCERNGLALTGHVLHENSLSSQVSTNGSVQRCYPLLHVPGIDYLGEHGREYWVAKQVDSAARQFRRPWVLSELYGCTGWQMNFESHKAVGAWQALFGVNLRCHHLSWYTMAGEAKRDYPASILHQSPWHKEYDTVETWFARLGYFRAQGEPCCDLLVLNPVESVWGRVYPGAIRGMNAADPGIRALEGRYAALFHILVGNHVDFDYGDEALLAEHGGVEAEGTAATLRLGAMRYTTVVVAGADTVRSSTLALLQRFVEAGGRVLFAGDAPGFVDSLPSGAVATLAESALRCAFEEPAILRALAGHTETQVRIAATPSGDVARDVFCQLRVSGDAHFLTVLNTSREEVREVTVRLTGLGGDLVEEWDLETGGSRQIEAVGGAGADLSFGTTLHTSQARCFRIAKDGLVGREPCRQDCRSGSPQPARIAEDSTPRATTAPGIRLDHPTAYSLADKNICVLDLPAWSFDGDDENPVDDILQIDRKVRRQLGVPLRAGDMVQPWFRGSTQFPALGQLTLRYPVTVSADLADGLAGLQLVLETPERFAVRVNGTAVDTSRDSGWWVDCAFRRFALPAGLFREGRNEVVVTCSFSEELDLEAMYLLGDFAVALDGTTPCLGRLPDTLGPSSIVAQGFPFYSDGITYRYAVPEALVGQPVRVCVPAYEGAYLKLRSGGEERMIPWRPNEAVLTLGETLEVEICITRKNTFGPLHLKDPRPPSTGPGHFVPGRGAFSLLPVFIESGLLAPVELYANGRNTR